MNEAPQSSTDESSILYSLNELLDLEAQRIKDEAERRWQAELDADRRKQKEDAERKAAEEARLHKEAEQRRQVELAKREEEARIAAIVEAEFRRATLLSESEARLQVTEKSNEHERRLSEIRADRGKRRLRWLLLGSLLLSLAGGVWFSWSLAETRKNAEARRLAHERDSQEFAQRSLAMKDRFEKKLELLRQEKRMTELRRRQALERKALEEHPPPQKVPASRGSGSSGRAPVAPPPQEKTCEPGDPLCSDIGL